MLGHISPKAILKLTKDGAVLGLDIDPKSKSSFCRACAEAKGSKEPVPKVRAGPRATTIGEKIHSDVWGPTNIESSTKNTRHGCRPSLRLKSKGTVRSLTVHDTPEQNGISERYNRTVAECARALLKSSGLPKFLWTRAMEHANWLRNRTTTSGLEGKTPCLGRASMDQKRKGGQVGHPTYPRPLDWIRGGKPRTPHIPPGASKSRRRAKYPV